MHNRGFTLVEIMTVIAILLIILSLGLWVGIDFYKSYAFNTERDALVSMLQKARSYSMNNMDQVKHGVYLDGSRYVLFNRASFGSLQSEDEVYEMGPNMYIAEIPPKIEIVFDQLTGKSNYVGTFTLKDEKRSIVFDIGSQGRINW